MSSCAVCWGYGTLLHHDRESDSEYEGECYACLGTGNEPSRRYGDAPQERRDLETEFDHLVKRINSHFGST